MIAMNLLPWFLKIAGHEQNVRIPSAPSSPVVLDEAVPTSEPPEDSFGWMSAGEITQWWKPQGGSVTEVPSITTRTDPDWWFLPANQPSDAEIIEMGAKYLAMRSPILTVPFSLIEGARWWLPEEEVIYS